MAKAAENAISPTRAEDYPEWYQQIIKAADMAENSPVRGCMVIRPWGWGIWENIQKEMDRRIKATGHDNAYFPLFIPVSFMEKEAEHVEGFAKECAVVTHHRLELKDGKLQPAGELDEPLIVRPTSETIIGESFAKWVKSYRDLPLLINQWANVVRWEMRPRLFLRTAEFLWQEGHTAHASVECAMKEVHVAVEIYREVIEDILAMPVIIGEKPESERFPGADCTFSLEAMMQDRKALQAGTSHFLGQNFAKASGIRFLNSSGELEYAYTTSWGTSTRLIGGMIMTHADDDGLRVPPKVAPKHVVILPISPKPETEGQVFAYAEQMAEEIRKASFNGAAPIVHVDRRDIRGGEKNWQWIKKGIPIRIEVGPRDMESRAAVVYRRDKGARDKETVSLDALAPAIASMLEDIQQSYFQQAQNLVKAHTRTDIKDAEEFKRFFTPKNQEKPEIHGGFVRGPWCGDEEATRALISDLKVSIRCLPKDQRMSSGKCLLTGREAKYEAVFAKSY